jgi:hypothetical protein
LAKLLSLRVSFWVMYVRHKIIIFIILFIFLILYFYLYHFSFLKSALIISITIFVKYMLY